MRLVIETVEGRGRTIRVKDLRPGEHKTSRVLAAAKEAQKEAIRNLVRQTRANSAPDVP
jgi:hypothetical protein